MNDSIVYLHLYFYKISFFVSYSVTLNSLCVQVHISICYCQRKSRKYNNKQTNNINDPRKKKTHRKISKVKEKKKLESTRCSFLRWFDQTELRLQSHIKYHNRIRWTTMMTTTTATKTTSSQSNLYAKNFFHLKMFCVCLECSIPLLLSPSSLHPYLGYAMVELWILDVSKWGTILLCMDKYRRANKYKMQKIANKKNRKKIIIIKIINQKMTA